MPRGGERFSPLYPSRDRDSPPQGIELALEASYFPPSAYLNIRTSNSNGSGSWNLTCEKSA